MLCECFLQTPLDSIRLYYMVTIRADACVCQRSQADGFIYINVMVFQQQDAYDSRTLEITGGRRVWQYWLQRVAMVSVKEGRPTGLYDPEIRHKFRAFAEALPAPPGFISPLELQGESGHVEREEGMP